MGISSGLDREEKVEVRSAKCEVRKGGRSEDISELPAVGYLPELEDYSNRIALLALAMTGWWNVMCYCETRHTLKRSKFF